jgi:DNA-binding MarR family transcriptional regulator
MSLFDPDSMQEVLHGRIRLLILAALAKQDVVDFVELREMLRVQDGSLHHALKRLDEVKFILLEKGRDENGKSRTAVRLTADGRNALRAYLRDIQELAQSLPDDGR